MIRTIAEQICSLIFINAECPCCAHADAARSPAHETIPYRLGKMQEERPCSG
jgi:hypothetical protein